MDLRLILVFSLLLVASMPVTMAGVGDFSFSSPRFTWGVRDSADVFYLRQTISYSSWTLDSSLFKFTNMNTWSRIGFACDAGSFNVTDVDSSSITLWFKAGSQVARVWTPSGAPVDVDGPASATWNPDKKVTTMTSTHSGTVTLSWDPTPTETFYIGVKGEGNTLWWSTVDLGTKVQSPWNNLTGSSPSSPSIFVSGSTMYIGVRGSYDSLWWSTVNLNTMVQSSWNSLTGASPSSPSIYVSGSTMYIGVKGSYDSLWWSTVDLNTMVQSGWSPLTGSSPSSPSIYISGSKMFVAVHGASNTLWWSTVDLNTMFQSGWSPLTGSSPSSPSVQIS